MDAQFNSLMSLGAPNCWTICPWGHVTIFCSMSPAAKGPIGSASLPVGRSRHDRPYYVSRQGAACPQDKGRWPQ